MDETRLSDGILTPNYLAATEALKRLAGPLESTYRVAIAQFQMSIYYGSKVDGDPDFLFPAELLALFVQHLIGLHFAALP